MKKIILFLLMICMGVSLISCKKEKDPEPVDPPIVEPNPDDPTPSKLYPIGLDLSGMKTGYNIGETFDMSGLKADARLSDYTTKDVTDKMIVDSKKYDNSKDGTYEIIVFYTEEIDNVQITVKSFYFAIVGTGETEEENNGNDDPIKNFGPGLYKLDASVDLINYEKSAVIPINTKFADGYFVMKGVGSKRANAAVYAIELAKAETSWIEFIVTGTAQVTITCSSTGGSNTSVIALFNDENQLVANNEGITTVEGTNIITITYTITTGTYRILSQASTTYSTRGVRVYSIDVDQK